MIGGSYNTSSNFFQTRGEGREQPLSAMTITHGAADGLPAVGDYISEDFLQVLEVICSLKNTVITHLIGASQALRA
jgi:hypothetical protein